MEKFLFACRDLHSEISILYNEWVCFNLLSKEAGMSLFQQ